VFPKTQKMSREKSVKRTRILMKRRRRRFLPYPLALFLLLCAGTYLAAATLRSSAADLHVTAKVSGPAVVSPAGVISPADNQRFSAIPIPVSGSCPFNAAYVQIFSNGVMKGTAICDGSSSFSLLADLFPGANSLTVHVFNITDDEGPVSAPITVYYDVLQPPANKQGGGRQPVPSASRLQLFTDFVYKGYYAGDQVQWPLRVSGGRTPYAITVDWGDGGASRLTQNSAGDFNISHIYQRPGGYKGSFVVKVTAQDDSGAQAYLQFFVIVVNRQGVITSGNIFSKPPPSFGHQTGWLWIAWPAYAIVLVMTLSFWLGEREELVVLRKHHRLRR
jgi:hypothetical protein